MENCIKSQVYKLLNQGCYPKEKDIPIQERYDKLSLWLLWCYNAELFCIFILFSSSVNKYATFFLNTIPQPKYRPWRT